MGQITNELLEALEQARANGEEIVSITLYATGWGNLFKEGSGLTGHDGETRTFQGIPIKVSDLDPSSPSFVLHTK